MNDETRFWSKVDATGDCWEWTACRLHGYGLVTWNSKTSRAHRVAYEMLVGPIPEGLQLDHLCRNRACVNPDHLEPVTQQENLRRGYGTNSSRKQKCKWGHPFAGDNLYHVPGSNHRECRTCRKSFGRRKREEVTP